MQDFWKIWEHRDQSVRPVVAGIPEVLRCRILVFMWSFGVPSGAEAISNSERALWESIHMVLGSGLFRV